MDILSPFCAIASGMVGRKGRKEVIVNSEFKIAVYVSQTYGVGCFLIGITRKGSACGRRQVVGREVEDCSGGRGLAAWPIVIGGHCPLPPPQIKRRR